MGFIKGMITGLLVGSAVTMIADPISDRQRHKMQKKTEGFFKADAYKFIYFIITMGNWISNMINNI